MKKEGLVEAVMEERKVLEAINRLPFVVKFKCAFQSSRNLYLVQEYYAGGEFLSILKHHRRGLTVEHARFYAQEILFAIKGIHRLGIVYRDLKPENCLVAADGHIALTDFGTAVMEGPNRSRALTELAGTISYMAPECLAGEQHGQAVDLWSFGVMIFEMLTARTPFAMSSPESTQRRILTGMLNIPSHFDAVSTDFVQKLLNRNVEERLDVAAAMRHPFFGDVDWTKVLAKQYTPPILPTRGSLDTEAGIEELEELEMFSSIARTRGRIQQLRASVTGSPSATRDCVESWRVESPVR